MFNIGEIIYLPVFGAGRISSIEDKEIHGEISKYYIIDFIINDISIMIPVNSKEARKMRRAINKEEYNRILNITNCPGECLPNKWNERYKYYKEQINSGDVFSLFSILKDIACMSRVKKLSKSEIKVFKEILNMVSSELSLVLNYDYDETRKSILGMLGMGREFH